MKNKHRDTPYQKVVEEMQATLSGTILNALIKTGFIESNERL